ncbi:MAG: tRNA1(Val) (adenine(37)-N6)-methyltransferase [Pseudobdellovibrionaceae bacterium]
MGLTSTQTTLLDKKVTLKQSSTGFRAGLDTVMVAAACPAKPKSYVLDAGCGAGGALYCLMVRVPDLSAKAIDVSDEYIALARENAEANGWAEQVECVSGDFLTMAEDTRFDHILTNPPYLEEGTHYISTDPLRAQALGHLDAQSGTEAWLKKAHRLLKSKGSLTLIQRADMLDKIILGLGKRFGATEIFPLVPKEGEPAKRVIIRTWKDRASPLTLHSPLVIHKKDGTYTGCANAILKDAKPIEEGLHGTQIQG